MIVFGIALALGGLVLFFSSLAKTLRANADVAIPMWTNAAVVPPGSIAMRSLGGGLIVFGAVALIAGGGWWWLAMIVALSPSVAMVPILTHNRKVAQES
ncbi:hypothetical protein [Microbacterium sp. PMB16]|uniref:hypothetical protein n=1 Tax=Microbacterium sp. PMB16 TaxID=3120157 RepID=UPI003F4C1D4F